MDRGWRRRRVLEVGVGALLGLSGCSTRDSTPTGTAGSTGSPDSAIPSPTATGTDRATGSPTESPTDSPTRTPEPTATREPVPEGHYAGPIDLVHEHYRGPLGFSMDRLAFDEYESLMNRHGIRREVAFMRPEEYPVAAANPDRVLPYMWGPNAEVGFGSATLSDLPSLVEAGLASDREWAGIGELHWSIVEGERTFPDHEAFMACYELAADHDLVAMVHPPKPKWEYRADPLESPAMQALARAFEANPETTFLVHGLVPDGYVNDLLADYGNWYYDASGMIPPHMFFSNEPASGIAKRDFLEHMTDEHIEAHVDWALADDRQQVLEGTYECDPPRPEFDTAGCEYRSYGREQIWTEHPDRCMIGWDKGHPLSWDPEIIDRWMTFTRALLGRLDADVARKLAYENAERVLVGRRG